MTLAWFPSVSVEPVSTRTLLRVLSCELRVLKLFNCEAASRSRPALEFTDTPPPSPCLSTQPLDAFDGIPDPLRSSRTPKEESRDRSPLQGGWAVPLSPCPPRGQPQRVHCTARRQDLERRRRLRRGGLRRGCHCQHDCVHQ